MSYPLENSSQLLSFGRDIRGWVASLGKVIAEKGALVQHSLHFARVTSKSLNIPDQKTACFTQFDMLTTPWCAACKLPKTSSLRVSGTTTLLSYITQGLKVCPCIFCISSNLLASLLFCHLMTLLVWLTVGLYLFPPWLFWRLPPITTCLFTSRLQHKRQLVHPSQLVLLHR